MKEKIPINVRCYIGKSIPDYEPLRNPSFNRNIVLVFDTETTADQYQNLLFGTCGIWIKDELHKFYFFYNDDLAKKDVSKLESFASKMKKCEVVTRTEFVDKVFYPYVYEARAQCVAFNMPFDLSRLATGFGETRGIQKYQNGFSLHLSKNWYFPDIRVKSLNSKSSFIEFTKPKQKNSGKNSKKKSEQVTGLKNYKGYFLDLKTLTFCLTNESYNLKNALKDFECVRRKMDADEHGVIKKEYLEYNVNDTLATHELYQKATERYRNYLLDEQQPNFLYSPASIGKAFLKKIGINSFAKQNKRFPPKVLGYVMMTYYGGRTEVRIRKQPKKASYIDFTSMYPSIFTLIGMYRFLIADKITYKNTTKTTQEFLNNVKLDDVAEKETWKKFVTICKIRPDDDILPVRSTYDPKNVTTNIGINHLKSTDGTALWYTLPDLVASKILTGGKTPIIEEAITFAPKGIQKGIRDIDILKGILLKKGEDFIKKLIEERIRLKDRLENPDVKLSADEKKLLKLQVKILKIIANSTSYGIFIQINSSKAAKKKEIVVNGFNKFKTKVERIESPGEYFNPVMSVFLTAGSRLILSAAEALALKEKGDVMYFDTDSIFVSPEQAKSIQEFFEKLNPYEVRTDMFKVEEGKDTEQKAEDVWFYGISAKRYVIYDYDAKSHEIKIHQHSAHGLGHIQDIDEIKWWKNLLSDHYSLESREKILGEYKNQYAVSQLTVSTQEIMRRFAKFNEGRPYHEMIKPFNFITVGAGYKKDPETEEPIIPMMPFVDKNHRHEVPFRPFVDYKTGTEYPNDENPDTQVFWKPLSDAFEDYTKKKENKMEGDEGLLKRRHLEISKFSINHIGKETNDIEVSEVIGVTSDSDTNYFQFAEIIKAIKISDGHKVGLKPSVIQDLKKSLKEKKELNIQSKTKKKLLEYARKFL